MKAIQVFGDWFDALPWSEALVYTVAFLFSLNAAFVFVRAMPMMLEWLRDALGRPRPSNVLTFEPRPLRPFSQPARKGFNQRSAS